MLKTVFSVVLMLFGLFPGSAASSPLEESGEVYFSSVSTYYVIGTSEWIWDLNQVLRAKGFMHTGFTLLGHQPLVPFCIIRLRSNRLTGEIRRDGQDNINCIMADGREIGKAVLYDSSYIKNMSTTVDEIEIEARKK